MSKPNLQTRTNQINTGSKDPMTLFISNNVKKHKRKGVDSLFVTRGKRGRT